MQYRTPFLIGGIASVLRWLELLVFTISAPVLTLATGIAVTDLMTHGSLLSQHPELLFVYGVCLALGIDSQLPASWERIRECFETPGQRRWLLLWLPIALYVAFVVLVSLQVFGFQQSQGLSETQALAQLGIDPGTWQLQRSLLGVGLVALSGFNRVRARKPTKAEEREVLERELELEPLRQRLTEVKASGVVTVARSVAEAATNRGKTPKPKPPAGGGTPLAQRQTQAEAANRDTAPEAIRLATVPQRRVTHALTFEDKARRILRQTPNIGKRQLARLVGCSESHAGRLLRTIRQEQRMDAAEVI